MCEQTGSVNLGRQVRELEGNRLKLADRLPELLALLRVLQRSLVGALRHAQPQRGNGDAPAVEDLHGVHKAIAFLAQQVLGRDLAVLEDQLRGITGAQAKLVLFLTGAKSLGSLLNRKGRESMGVRRLVV